MLVLALSAALLVLSGRPVLENALREAGAQAGAVLERARLPGAGDALSTYDAAERSVSNWRAEAFDDLDPWPVSALAALLKADRPVVTRCVKLNNYWCIKRARWNGEIGFDEEGHVGFASAEHGADAAAGLLRRYYVDYGRKSALDIVRRWAPAECRPSPGTPAAALPMLAVRGIGTTLRARYLAAQRGRAGQPAVSPGPTATAGLAQAAGVTRAASAAAPAPAASPASAATPVPAVAPPTASLPVATAAAPPRRTAPLRAPSRVSSIPLRPLPSFKMVDIAAGVGERRPRPPAAAPVRVAPAPVQPRAPAPPVPQTGPAPVKRPVPRAVVQPTPAPAPPQATPPAQPQLAAPAPAAPPLSALACAPDETRIRNYAARLAAALGLQATDDLALFDPRGLPSPNLVAVMLSMSSVELGIMKASRGLVESAVHRLTLRVAAAADAASAASPQPPATP